MSELNWMAVAAVGFWMGVEARNFLECRPLKRNLKELRQASQPASETVVMKPTHTVLIGQRREHGKGNC